MYKLTPIMLWEKAEEIGFLNEVLIRFSSQDILDKIFLTRSAGALTKKERCAEVTLPLSRFPPPLRYHSQ
jgi:hypothetical protein